MDVCSISSALLLADLSSLPALIGVIFVVALGLGAVIFVHELGHFLVAKACGVKCEKFMLGFDVGGYKISHKWGETEYGIGILPLGGYVKMFGQDDDPAHIAEQLKKSEIGATSPDAVEVRGPKGEKYFVDRRSYLAKSVPQRMAIISAGVVMNVIFAFIFAAIAYGMGVKYMPSIVSETIPGSPAWRAGLQSGDEIVKIGDRVNPTFMQLKGGVTLGDMENGIPVVVRRAADGEEVELRLKPEQNQGRGLATIGIRPPFTNSLMRELPVIPDSPAARAKQISPPVTGDGKSTKFASGDEIISINGQPVKDYRGLAAELTRASGEPLRVTVRRPAKSKEAAHELTFEVAARPIEALGLVMQMGPITAMQPDSPAAQAGLKVGDVITAVDGQSFADAKTLDGWQPDTLSERMRLTAVAGQTVRLTVEREGKPLEINVTPSVPTEFHSVVLPRAPIGVPALGIAYTIGNEVVSVIPGSPAASAKIEPGDKVTSAEFTFPKDVDPKFSTEPAIVTLSSKEESWPAVFDQMQNSPAGTTLQLTIERGDQKLTKKLTPVAAEGLFVTDRGFLFDPIERVRRAESISEQIQYGWDETTEALGMVFRFLKKLGGQIPVTALGGPISIAKAAGYSAYDGLPSLLIFLTMLSANLAVLNFLPIPLLDGGHIAFLAYEGARGRPASERFVVALHTIGFVFIVSLMLFVLGLDLGWIPRNL